MVFDASTTSDVDLTGYFIEQADVAGAVVTQAATVDEVVATIRDLTGGSVRCTKTLFDLFPDLQAAFADAGLDVLTAGEIARAVRDRADLAVALAGKSGVIAAYAGVAETGSVLIADDALGNRLVGMLSETCIVVLAESSIVPGLDEAGALLSEMEAKGHRYMSLITGPSRTADIERVLTIGVQGPKVLHIVLVSGIHGTEDDVA
jgi:L-lactate dehydrogenase complex protein LldG